MEAMSKEFGQEVERRINEYVAQDLAITTVFLPRSEAGEDVFRGKASSIPRTQDPILPAEKIRKLEDEFIPKELQRDYDKTFGHNRH